MWHTFTRKRPVDLGIVLADTARRELGPSGKKGFAFVQVELSKTQISFHHQFGSAGIDFKDKGIGRNFDKIKSGAQGLNRAARIYFTPTAGDIDGGGDYFCRSRRNGLGRQRTFRFWITAPKQEHKQKELF